MLHHLHLNASRRQIRPRRRFHSVSDRGRNANRRARTSPHEYDAGTRRSGHKLDRDRTTAPIPDTGDRDGAANGLLRAHAGRTEGGNRPGGSSATLLRAR
jgi:hypothetical protein